MDLIVVMAVLLAIAVLAQAFGTDTRVGFGDQTGPTFR